MAQQNISEIPKLTENEIRNQSIRVAISRAEFMTQMPRFYKAFDYVDMYQDERVDTLGVAPQYDAQTKELNGFHDLIWSANFTNQLTEKQLLGVQMHELLHIILGHTTNRCPEYQSKKIDNHGQARLDPKSDAFKLDMVMMELWNIATDLSINCMIEKYLRDPGAKWQDGLFPGQGNFASFPKFKTAEWYFEELKKKHQQDMNDLSKALKDIKKAFQDGKIGSHGEWVETDEKGKVTSQGGKPVEKKEKEEGEAQDSEVTIEEIEKDIQEIAKDLGLGGKQAGTGNSTTQSVDLSAGKELKTPGWMKKTTHASTHGFEVSPVATRKVPNRRFGILFPGKKRVVHRNKCLIAVDVSGSIDSNLLTKFTQHLNRMKRHADFDLFFFNDDIIHPQTGQAYRPEEGEKALCKWKTGMKFYIGGGTSFEPLFQFWNRVRQKYDFFFIFTDGYASYSTPPKRNKEVNWILYGSPDNCKHGNKYQIGDSNE